ncbi:MAG: sugar transferase [Chloroflexi bacterium]|nr:sugar transferase [Chloroflexota bacterium]
MRAFYRRRGKRLLDLALTIPALICLAPLMGLVALLVRARLGAPVLFRQVRPGLHGQPFTMFKFRTMTGARDAEGNLLPDSERLTPLGRALRSASLDELPELWNVLRGEMSLVGPRPLRVEYLPLYTAEQARRHELCPGLTGWAQIRGRNSLSWEDRFALDVWYVDHCCLCLDLRICGTTIFRVVRRQDISAEGYATMPRFAGSQRNPDGDPI